MEPVRIRCQQCQGKLVIRTPELLGKSVVCPRCQSIVQVPATTVGTAPTAWASGNTPILPPSFDSTAVTKVQEAVTPAPGPKKAEPMALTTGDTATTSIPTVPEVSANGLEGEVGFLDWEDLPEELLGGRILEDLPYSDPSYHSSQQASIEGATASLESGIGNGISANRPLTPTADWVSPSTARTRLVLLVGTTALIVSVVAVVLFVMFLNSFASPKKEFALAPVQIEEPSPELGPELSPELDAGVLPAPDAEPKPVPNTAPGSPEPSTPSIKDAESQPNDAINSSDVGVLPKETADPVIPPAIAPDLKLGMSAQKRVEPNEPAPAPVDEVNMIPPAGLAQFAPVFELGGTGFSSDAATLEPIEPGFTGGGGVVDLGLLTHPSPVVPEPWDSVKSTAILKLRVAQKPLSEVLLVLGQLANSGLGWDCRLLHFSTIDPLQKVSVEAVNSTLEDELTKLATQVPFEKQIVAPNVSLAKDADKPPVGIPAEIPDETVVTRMQLIPVAKIVADQLPSEWSLDGLVRAEESANGAVANEAIADETIADETSLSQWNRILQTHFPPGDGLWAMDGMSIVWSPQASLADRASMAVFLDQVRQIYGSPTKSGFFQNSSDPAGRDLHNVMWMQPIQAYNVAYKQLRNKGVSVFAELRSSPALLDEAARECELELVMDWPSLQSHGFSHAASSLSLFRNRTWPQIAKRTMDQFDLVAVVDGPKRLILTTLAQQRRWPRSTILPLRPGESIESVGESFRVLSPTDERGLSILSVTPLPKKDAADSVEYVIIRHCPPNTKQLERLEVRRALHMTAEGL